MPLPPLSEQQKIVSNVDSCFVLIDAIDTNKELIEKDIADVKSKILELAIQGKLVEQDENDEPASVLLERIRAEKKAQLGKKYVERLSKLLKYAKSIGVKTSFTAIVNEAFSNSPVELRADWTGGHDGYKIDLCGHYHIEICPSKPGGIEKILEYRREYLEAFRDVEPDYFLLFPYDQGGCTCPDCAPWGGNGYIRCCEAIIPLLKEYWPNVKPILCTWYFAHFYNDVSEFELLKKAIEDGKFADCPYLMAEPYSHKYAFENDMLKPLIGFPEISMCNVTPWGGYGAAPIPKRLQKIFDRDGDKLEGGTPYCEGFFEDINKVIMLRFYRDDQSASDTIKEYLTYEFGLTGEILERVHDAIFDMDDTLWRGWDPGHRYPISHPEKVFDIEKAILDAHAILPENIKNSKKWLLIYYRAVIDAELARNNFSRNEKVLQYFKEMISIYHLEKAGFHVKPDIIEDEDFGRPLTRQELITLCAGGTLDDIK